MNLIKTIIFIFAGGAFFFAAAQEQKLEFYLEAGHAGSVRYVGFSDDGRFLASRDMNLVAKIWDVQTGRELKSFQSSDAAISPDGKMLLTAYFKVIKLLRLETGEELLSFTAHDSAVNSIAFSPDGKLFASASVGEVKIWEAATGREIKRTAFPAPNVSILSFSPDNRTLACVYAASPNDLKLISVETGKELKTFKGHSASVISAAFSQNGRMIATGSRDIALKIWDVQSGRMIKNIENAGDITGMAFSPDGQYLAYGDTPSPDIIVWDIASEKKIRTMKGHNGTVGALRYSNDGRLIASGGEDNGAKIWNAESGEELKNLAGRVENIHSLVFTPNGEKLFSETFNGIIKIWELNSQRELASFGGRSGVISPGGNIFAYAGYDVNDNTIRLLNPATGEQSKISTGHKNRVESISFSPDGKLLATGGIDHDIKIWNAASREELKTLKGHTDDVVFTTFSPDGKYLASIGDDKAIKIWSVETGKELHSLAGEADNASSLLFADVGGKLFLVTTTFDSVKAWDAVTGKLFDSRRLLDANSSSAIYELWQRTTENRRNTEPAFRNGKFKAKNGGNGKINLYDAKTNKLLAGLIALGETDWIVTTPDGRFDTNKSLDNIEGLHWIVNDEILKPLPLDVFMRQYYEPNLLRRVLAGEQFKPLPSIADINRVQPKVTIKPIKSAANGDGLADVTVEIESVKEDVSVGAADRTKKKQLVSGAYDLRLFRDGQLVGTSAAKKDLEDYIRSAPALVEKDKAAGTLINTEEDKAWRAANDIFKLKGENVKFVSPERVEYTFHNVKLPRDGRETVEFTAYAFNSDKVKSATTAPFKFAVPKAIVNAPTKGRAVVVSIGVNASENAAYNLRYAANDARNMQTIIGKRLEADADKYSEVVEISLVSDYDKNGNVKPNENNARKAIINAVFSLLAGKSFEAAAAEIKESAKPEDAQRLIDDLKKISVRQKTNGSGAANSEASLIGVEKTKAIEPEDTLIITYAGHGYADSSGIFYLLPYDIGANTAQLTTNNLGKMISSDELSLWMQDITAGEMIMIIDACHSSAAVQGDGFKPGPMGSRGLGQLAYDKDMKILSATQANNVALELNSLEQGLLSYALLHDGIEIGLADSSDPKDNRLFAAEWLSFAERRVPELYREVKDGKRGIIVDGKPAQNEADRSVVVDEGNQKSSLDLQQPSLFDFKRRAVKSTLFNLP